MFSSEMPYSHRNPRCLGLFAASDSISPICRAVNARTFHTESIFTAPLVDVGRRVNGGNTAPSAVLDIHDLLVDTFYWQL